MYNNIIIMHYTYYATQIAIAQRSMNCVNQNYYTGIFFISITSFVEIVSPHIGQVGPSVASTFLQDVSTININEVCFSMQ